MMPTNKEDLTPSTFLVTYEDDTTDIIKPVSWKKLDDVEALCLEILKNAYDLNFSLSSILKPSNIAFWDNATKLASILPVVGRKEPGFDPTRIESMDDLCTIFISASKYRKKETGSVWNNQELLEPSEICRIHHLNFINLLLEAEKQVQKEQAAKAKTTSRRKSSQTTETK